MAYELNWLVENKVIEIGIHGEIELDTIEAMSKEILDYIEMSDMPLVHVMIDDEDVTTSIKQIKGVVNVGKAMNHPRFGWLIIYGSSNKMFQFMSYLISQISKVRFRRFSTRAEALEFLRTVDTTLPTVEEILGS